MSGARRIISGEAAQSGAKGKSLSDTLSAKLQNEQNVSGTSIKVLPKDSKKKKAAKKK